MAKTIMIVDDERDIRTSVRMVLEKNGYKTIAAVDADDCMKKLQEVTPDLILLDIMMPGTPVKEVIPKIKDIKIAFLSVVRTSEAEKEDLLKAPNIVDFIQKPFNIKDLIKRIEKIIGKGG